MSDALVENASGLAARYNEEYEARVAESKARIEQLTEERERIGKTIESLRQTLCRVEWMISGEDAHLKALEKAAAAVNAAPAAARGLP